MKEKYTKQMIDEMYELILNEIETEITNNKVALKDSKMRLLKEEFIQDLHHYMEEKYPREKYEKISDEEYEKQDKIIKQIKYLEKKKEKLAEVKEDFDRSKN